MAVHRVARVRAFTGRRARGNGAGVLVLDAPLLEGTMQAIARRVALSETAFLWPEADAWRLRWFTPTTEVDLCGHATLASAHQLWAAGRLAAHETARFETKGGPLAATKDGPWIELDFPARALQRAAAPPGLAEALGARPVALARAGTHHLVAELADAAAVRALAPHLDALERVAPKDGVAVTAPADEAPFDYVCRYFAPGFGVPEDPATGSIQCALGPYWAARLGRPTLTAFQASPGGGVLRVRPQGARVLIGGRAESDGETPVDVDASPPKVLQARRA